MVEVTVGSYNMSFASDQGKEIGSEMHFIHDNLIRLGGTKNTRILWENSLKLVKQFGKKKEIL